MFKPNYQITNKILNYTNNITEARAIILNASLIPKWEVDLRQEALLRSTHASTSIEGNRLSFEEVSDLMLGRDVIAFGKDKQEVLNYCQALKVLNNLTAEQKPKLNNQDILKLQGIITKDVLADPKNCGRYRSGKQYVIVGNPKTGKITFRPPATKDVPKLMFNFINWLNDTKTNELHPVIKAGISHYEFVRIHPFMDGNGRTARVLATLILIRREFDIKRFFCLDDFYNSDRPRYYGALKTVNQETLDLTEWLEYFCEGVAVSIKAVKDKVIDLTGVKKQIALDKEQMAIVRFMRENEENEGKITNKQVRGLLKVSNKTAYNLLHSLIKDKVIISKGKSRNIYYVLR